MRAMATALRLRLVPAGADLQRDRHRHRRHHRLQDARHQGLVLHQRGAGHHVADLLGRTAHVDVDDLRAALDVVARGLRHHPGVCAGDLHRYRLRLPAMVGAAQVLAEP